MFTIIAILCIIYTVLDLALTVAVLRSPALRARMLAGMTILNARLAPRVEADDTADFI